MRSMGRRAEGARLERLRASPRWAGDGFRNLHPILPGLRDPGVPMPTLTEFLCGGERRVPRAPLPALNPLQSWLQAPGSGLRATWLGHSTVLIEIDGYQVLTDPVWGPRASPSRLLPAQALSACSAAPAFNAALDLVVISHDHYDHLDYPTIRELASDPFPFSPRSASAHTFRLGAFRRSIFMNSTGGSLISLLARY